MNDQILDNEFENFEKLSELLGITPHTTSTLLKYLCPLCFSMIDRGNPFYKAGGYCPTFYIC